MLLSSHFRFVGPGRQNSLGRIRRTTSPRGAVPPGTADQVARRSGRAEQDAHDGIGFRRVARVAAARWRRAAERVMFGPQQLADARARALAAAAAAVDGDGRADLYVIYIRSYNVQGGCFVIIGTRDLRTEIFSRFGYSNACRNRSPSPGGRYQHRQEFSPPLTKSPPFVTGPGVPYDSPLKPRRFRKHSKQS